MHDVPVLDDILFSFEAHQPLFLGAGFAITGYVIVESDYFGPDKPFFKIGVNNARGLWRLGAINDRPGADLLDSGCKIRDEAQQSITVSDKTIKARFLQTHIIKKALFFRAIKLGDLRLKLAADNYNAGSFGGSYFPDLGDVGVSAFQVVYRHVGNIKYRLVGQEMQVTHPDSFVFVLGYPLKLFNLFEKGSDPDIKIGLVLCLLVAAARHFFRTLHFLFDRVKVGQS